MTKVLVILGVFLDWNLPTYVAGHSQDIGTKTKTQKCQIDH